MILYRCGKNPPEGIINPSNWATNSCALGAYIDSDMSGAEFGDKIFVIEIPNPKAEEIGPYIRINRRQPDGDPSHPFGDDKNGWWSFNRPFHGAFRIVEVIELSSVSGEEIERIDTRFKPQAEWPEWLKKARWKDSVLAAIAGMSRTLGGVSDTSSSADKPKLGVEGDTLARQTTENLEHVLELLWSNQDRKFTSVAEVREFIDMLAEKVSEGLLPVGQSLHRTWETKFGQTPVAEIETEYQNFCAWLLGALADIDFVEVAALVEKRLDGKIHPFADGCGRTSKLLASFILLRGNRFPSRYSDRREYYREINKSDREWVSYYRLLPHTA